MRVTIIKHGSDGSQKSEIDIEETGTQRLVVGESFKINGSGDVYQVIDIERVNNGVVER